MSYFERMAQRVRQAPALSPRIPSLYEGSASPDVQTLTETPAPAREKAPVPLPAPTEPWPTKPLMEPLPPIAPKMAAPEQPPAPLDPLKPLTPLKPLKEGALEPPAPQSRALLEPPLIRPRSEPPAEPRAADPWEPRPAPLRPVEPRPTQPLLSLPRVQVGKSALTAESDTPGTIRVHIGRIDVRTVFPTPPPATRVAAAPERPTAMSLDRFLTRGRR